MQREIKIEALPQEGINDGGAKKGVDRPGLRIISWNMGRRADAWTSLTSLEPTADLDLLQEAIPPGSDIDVQTVPDRDAPWRTAGGNRHFCTSVARLNDQVRMEAIADVPLGEAAKGQFAVSRLGTLAAANITLDGEEPLTIVSLYAPWERPRDGGWIVSDASAHRLISDLCFFVGSQRGHRVIAAGDLNILFGYGEDGSPYWRERYGSVFSRMAAIGFSLIGPQYPNGVQADPWPSELPIGSQNVPTFRTRQSDPTSATRQLDFVFASDALKHRVQVKALNNVDEWGPSDHCRLLIDFT